MRVGGIIAGVLAFIIACTGVAQALTTQQESTQPTAHMTEVAREGMIAECMQLRATLTVQYGMTDEQANTQARTMGCD